MSLTNIIFNINEHNIMHIWSNIYDNNNCNLCYSVVQNVLNGHDLLTSICKVYQQQNFIFAYIFENLMINVYDIRTLLIIKQILTLYNNLITKIKNTIIYVLFIFLIILFVIFILYFIYNISIYIIIINFIISFAYLFFSIRSIINKIKYIILLNVFHIFMLNIHTIYDLRNIYYKLYNKQINIYSTQNFYDLSKLFLNINVLSISHIEYLIKNNNDDLIHLVNLFHTKLINIIIINTGINAMYILYIVYKSIISNILNMV